VLVSMSGFGRWSHAPPNPKETFGFATRPAQQVCASPPPPPCRAAYPDTAFIDFSIPTLTTFEVSSDARVLTEVAETAPLGDFQYRKVMLTDGSGATSTYRVAVSVPSSSRTWCPPTVFPLDIFDISTNPQGPTRSAPLPLRLIWGRCPTQEPPTFWWSEDSGSTGTSAGSNGPSASTPPTPTPDCPDGGFSREFNVCERCGGGSGRGIEKTFWGCDFNEATQKMGQPGCFYTLRSGINCP
jgi:hypothetical protein